MKAKEVREILDEYARWGFRIERNKHIKVYDGPRLVAVVSSTQCGGRAEANAKAALKRNLRQRQAVAA